MQGKRERPLIAGFIYRIDGCEGHVIPVTGRRGGWVFYRVYRDEHGTVFRGGVADIQPDSEGCIFIDGKATDLKTGDMILVSDGEVGD